MPKKSARVCIQATNTIEVAGITLLHGSHAIVPDSAEVQSLIQQDLAILLPMPEEPADA
jgi:hypothetical protein